MENNKLLLIIAVVAGIFATVLAFTYINNATSGVQTQAEPMAQVLRVVSDLPANHVLDPDRDLVVDSVPSKRFAGWVRTLYKADEKESLRGQRIAQPVAAGQPLQYADLAMIQDTNLAPGTRAMGIRVAAQNLMGGLLLPGDRVDVVATYRIPKQVPAGAAAPSFDASNPNAALGAIFSKLTDSAAFPDEFQSVEILSNVRVIGVGGSLAGSRQQFMFNPEGGASQSGDRIITVEVTSDQAIDLIQASTASKDTLTLLLRPPTRQPTVAPNQGG
jgi:Flp pilus assembly protein CpaB